jgi:formylglycine-generating enzyme required for sulfatase activity
VAIPAGTVTLGLRPGAAGSFGWDNEFEACTAEVTDFAIDAYPVTNRRYLEFVRAGSYGERSLWSEKDWEWLQTWKIEQPRFWRRRGNEWFLRTLFAEISLPLDWPVYVGHAEANAYARWSGQALPTEAQWHRAAYGTPEGTERDFPWGAEPPVERFGNFDFVRWDPMPVGSHPDGASAFGVHDLVGNGWEWTSTLFEPFPNFKPFTFYPGYSADFFDRQHYVVKGGSARTGACLLRRSFRNWYQPHYPYVYATFRCVEN